MFIMLCPLDRYQLIEVYESELLEGPLPTRGLLGILVVTVTVISDLE